MVRKGKKLSLDANIIFDFVQVSTLSWTKSSEVTAVGSNPKWPYLIAVRADGKINTFNLFDPTYPMELNEAFLSRNRLDAVRFWRSGAQFCVASRDIGEFFLVKVMLTSDIFILNILI